MSKLFILCVGLCGLVWLACSTDDAATSPPIDALGLALTEGGETTSDGGETTSDGGETTSNGAL